MAKTNFLKGEFLQALKDKGIAATLKEAEAQYAAVFEIIQEAVVAGKQVQLPNLGIIEEVVLPAGTATVPGTDRKVEVPARKKIKLRSKPKAE